MNSFHFRSAFDVSLVNSGPDALLESSQFKILVVLAGPRLDLSPWGFGIWKFSIINYAANYDRPLFN
jgi:hypothetical protein